MDGESQSSSLQRWHTLLNARLQVLQTRGELPTNEDMLSRALYSKLCAHPEVSCLNLAKAEDVLAPDHVRAWVAGKDVPRERATHNALLEILGLKATEPKAPVAKKGKGKPKPIILSVPMQRVLDLRQEMNHLQDQVCREHCSTPRVTVHCNGAQRVLYQGISMNYGSGTEQIPDLPHLPRREICRYNMPASDYQHLSSPELRDIMAHTGHAGEFLRCWRLLHEGDGHRLRQEEAADRMGYGPRTYHEVETGHALVSGRFMQDISTLFASETANYEQFCRLAIANRLQAFDWYMQPGPHYDQRHAVAELYALPHAYWAEALRQANGAPGQAPSWSDVVRPLSNQGEYLRAVRLASGLMLEDVYKNIRGDDMSEKKFFNKMEYIEDDMHLADEAMVSAVTDFYERHQQATSAQRWFDRAAFDALPSGSVKLSREALKRHLHKESAPAQR